MFKHVQSAVSELTRAAVVGVALGLVLLMTYLAFEPMLSHGLEATDNRTFEITQEITGEIAFATPPSDITMDPPIQSLTGGTSTGATQVRITTNDPAGYNMTISFASSTAMRADTSTSSIPNYVTTVADVPDFQMAVPDNSAGFAYSVEASSTGEITALFRDNGSTACNTGSFETVDRCFLNPSTTAETIINTSSAPPTSGSTSTVKFQLVVRSNPNPVIPIDTYTATATLTATTN